MKKFYTLITGIMMIAFSFNAAKANEHTPEENKKTLQKLFEETYHDSTITKEKAKKLIENYLHKDYVQHVDGKILYFKDMLPHRLNQLKRIKDIQITFEHLVAEGDKVYSIHTAQGKRVQDNSPVKARIFALFRFREGKIYLCDELTHLVEGEEEDKDIGSKH